jgi:HMG (high mobility group) box
MSVTKNPKMSMFDSQHVLNGVGMHLHRRDELIINCIATAFDLDVEKVRAAITTSLSEHKLVPIKPQKNPKKGGAPKQKKINGYGLFGQKNRELANKKLIEGDKKERTLKKLDGTTIVIELGKDKDGNPRPTVTQTGQKIANMWGKLSEEEKEEWKEKAKKINADNLAKPVVKPTPKKGGKKVKFAESESESEEEESESEEEEESSKSESEESEEETPKTSTKGKGRKGNPPKGSVATKKSQNKK